MNDNRAISTAYTWVHVFIASIMMLATFPGRTQALGMVTESLLADMSLDRTIYASYNLYATLIGSLFCLPIGRWIDRYGCRTVLAGTLVLLGASVIWMSHIRTNHIAFLIALSLTRGLGQSALSVLSIALISKYCSKKLLAPAMGVYSFLTSILFMGAFIGMGKALSSEIYWRTAWYGVGMILLVFCLPLSWFVLKNRSMTPTEQKTPEKNEGMTLFAALKSPAFWVFALSISFYNLVISGIGLFNESILAERGFSKEMYYFLLGFAVPFALACNILTGLLCRFIKVQYVLAGTLFPMAFALFLFPFVKTPEQVYAYSIMMACGGGAIMVLFFTVWADFFGRLEQGRIQGVAQMATVVSSAVGPFCFAIAHKWTGSYSPTFYLSGIVLFMLAITACRIKRPEYAMKNNRIDHE